MAYTLSGSNSNANSGGNSVSVTLSIGPTPGPFVVVAIVSQPQNITTSSVTVGTGGAAITLHQDVVDANNVVALFSGVVTGLSGNQTITYTSPSSISFQTVCFCLWYMESTTVNVNSATGDSVSSFPISVTAGNYLFAIGEAGHSFNFNPSTQTPFENTTIVAGIDNALTADWTISSSNSLFSVSAGTSIGGAAAGYNVPSPPVFSTPGMVIIQM